MFSVTRLKAQVEDYQADEQVGFRKDSYTVKQILMVRQSAVKKQKGKTKWSTIAL